MKKYIYENGGNKMTSRLENKINEYRNSDKFLCESAVEYILDRLAENIYIMM